MPEMPHQAKPKHPAREAMANVIKHVSRNRDSMDPVKIREKAQVARELLQKHPEAFAEDLDVWERGIKAIEHTAEKRAEALSDPIPQHVDSLVETLSRPSLEKIRLVVPQLAKLSQESPGHPKLAELEEAVQRARIDVSGQLLAEIGKEIPEEAREHLDNLMESARAIESGEDDFIRASKSLVIAANKENLALMGRKCIPPAKYEASKRLLGKISSLHDLLMVQDKSHLSQFLNLLEAAKECVAK